MNKTIFQLLFIVILLLFILAIVHIFDAKEGYDDASVSASPSAFSPSTSSPSGTPVSLTTYDPANYNVQYHATAEDIQTQLGTDTSANLVNASDSTYYTSGTLKYNPANYIPNYEDTIYFSKLTGLGYQSPAINTNAQYSGFCSYDRYFPEKQEEKCGKLDAETCASTTCCVLMGGKCVAGSNKGPHFKAHYSDLDLKTKDKYYYMGRCYGNCIDDQSNFAKYSLCAYSSKYPISSVSNDTDSTCNYYDYSNINRQTIPGYSQDNPAFFQNTSDYLATIAPNEFSISSHLPISPSSSSVSMTPISSISPAPASVSTTPISSISPAPASDSMTPTTSSVSPAPTTLSPSPAP